MGSHNELCSCWSGYRHLQEGLHLEITLFSSSLTPPCLQTCFSCSLVLISNFFSAPVFQTTAPCAWHCLWERKRVKPSWDA